MSNYFGTVITVTDVVGLLEYGGIHKIKVRADEINFQCPFHRDNTPSASINFTKKVFHCFSCGAAHTLYGFLKKLNLHDILSGVRSYYIDYQVRLDEENQLRKIIADYEDLECLYNPGNLEEGRSLFEEAGPISQHDQSRTYMEERLGKNYKFPIEVRYNKDANCVVFKTPYNYVRRSLDPDVKLRYLTYGPELNLFCSYKRLAGPLIIVEGVFDYLSCCSFGYQNSAAMLNASLTDKQLVNLSWMNFSEVVFCPDNDKAGVKNLKKNIKVLTNTVDTPVSIMILRGKKDVNNLSFDEFMTFFHQRKNVADIKKSKLDRVAFC